MGKFSDRLAHEMRGRRLAKRIKHPAGVCMVMWCPLCTKEVVRSEVGLSTVEQQAAIDRHAAVCVRKRMKLVGG